MLELVVVPWIIGMYDAWVFNTQGPAERMFASNGALFEIIDPGTCLITMECNNIL
jgi:hypothetical protein